ncbi:MAG: hypothetical protein ACTTIL_08025, partial [Bacteroidia bacterium]
LYNELTNKMQANCRAKVSRFFSLRPAPVQAEAFFPFCRYPLRARIGKIAVVLLAQLLLAGCKRKNRPPNRKGCSMDGILRLWKLS